MKFEIKHRLNGEILFKIETDSWKLAVEAAIKAKANLRSANLSSANLSSANLSSANLSSANLSSANLSFANLSSANLSSANLSFANLSSANLSFANLSSANLRFAKNIPQSYINICSRDMLFVFEHLKSELPFLRKALIDGKVNGTQYAGDCACLIGTLAKAKNITTPDDIEKKICPLIPFYDMGLHNPGEQWFWQIREGDTPDKSFFAKHAVELIDSVLKTATVVRKPRKPTKK
jgi:hypothetical protein